MYHKIGNNTTVTCMSMYTMKNIGIRINTILHKNDIYIIKYYI